MVSIKPNNLSIESLVTSYWVARALMVPDRGHAGSKRLNVWRVFILWYMFVLMLHIEFFVFGTRRTYTSVAHYISICTNMLEDSGLTLH